MCILFFDDCIEMQILCKKCAQLARGCQKLTVARVWRNSVIRKGCNPTNEGVLASVKMKNTLCYFGKKEVKILAPL